MTTRRLHFTPATGTTTELIPGYQGRFVHGDQLTVAIWDVKAGSEVPSHSHPHEQIVNCLEGTFEMRVGGEVYLMGPGDSVVVPGGVEHSAVAHTHARCLDVFHPVRDDYRI
ncbi:cupin domain-containing protein [Micromonospora sp. MSM11]|nr:cupin domain-containing protein [Micromonospora sp. MSM11]MCL7458338.1 cupin domain-containing protein [Micromonospora sp. MSM11]